MTSWPISCSRSTTPLAPLERENRIDQVAGHLLGQMALTDIGTVDLR
jgi:hypothetical protein